ncbi:MAG TPA: MFS transporter [Chloroflexi bacterium]|nr:MFS transporter [Chloroflexota bacterium]
MPDTDILTRDPSIKPSSAYARAAWYYSIMWGALALVSSFIAIDLNRRGVTETQWGILSALRAAVVFLASPMIARLADRREQRVKMLVLVLLLNGFSILLYMLPDGFSGFLVVSLVVNLFAAGIMPLGDGVVVRMAARHKLEYGHLRLWGSIGYAVFGVLGGLLWRAIGYSLLYWVGCMMTIGVAWLASRLEEPQAPLAIGSTIPLPDSSKTVAALLLGDTVLLIFLFAAFLRASSELMFFSFSALYIDHLTGSAFFTGLITGGAAILEVPVMIYTQRFIRRMGLLPVVMMGFFIQAVGMALFTFTINPWVMFVAAALRNMGFAFYFVATVQFIDRRAGAANAVTYQGLLSSFSWGLAPLIVSPLSGWIYQHHDAQLVFIISTLLAVLSALMMIPVRIMAHREQKNAVQEP